MIRRIVSSQHRVFTLFLAAALAMTGVLATTGGVAAAAPTTSVVVPIASPVLPANGLHLTSAQVTQANESLGFLSQKDMWSEFTGVNGALSLKNPLSVLQAKYNLSAAQVQTIKSILAFDKARVHAASTSPSKSKSTSASKAGVVSPNLSTSGTVIYFTYSDVGGMLITAASAGTWALYAQLTALASLFGGPVGFVIGVVLGFIGGITLGNLAYRIVQGYGMHQGIYFGITWNGFWPNFVMDNWCGCN